MAKQRQTTPIGKSDLVDYLDSQSDFAFELRVLKALSDEGFTCEHGGSYTDRQTKKKRQFDVRATKRVGGIEFLRLAVECKNLRPHLPLLVLCVPRPEVEAYHEIIVSVDPEKLLLEEPPEFHSRAMLSQSKSIRLTGAQSLYQAGHPVGKSCAQVGRTTSGEITAIDSEVFEKWSQALGSADDLSYQACRDGIDRVGYAALSLVFPILVVPNGQLWIVDYDNLGNRISDPRKVNRCPYFVDQNYFHYGGFTHDQLTVTHLEFVTTDGLLTFINDLVGDEERRNWSFPLGHVEEAIGGFLEP